MNLVKVLLPSRIRPLLWIDATRVSVVCNFLTSQSSRKEFYILRSRQVIARKPDVSITVSVLIVRELMSAETDVLFIHILLEPAVCSSVEGSAWKQRKANHLSLIIKGDIGVTIRWSRAEKYDVCSSHWLTQIALQQVDSHRRDVTEQQLY